MVSVSVSERIYLLLQLLFDVRPDLADFEVRVHLDYLNFLLFGGMQIIFGETCAVENAKDYGS